MPDETNLITRAKAIAQKKHKVKGGLSVLARACGVAHTSAREWELAGRLPMCVLLDFRDYHERLAEAVDNEITAQEFKDWTHAAWVRYYAENERPL